MDSRDIFGNDYFFDIINKVCDDLFFVVTSDFNLVFIGREKDEYSFNVGGCIKSIVKFFEEGKTKLALNYNNSSDRRIDMIQ